MSKGRILVITSDKSLVAELSAAYQSRDFEIASVATAEEAVPLLGWPFRPDDANALVIDAACVPRKERDVFLSVHKEKRAFMLFIIEPEVSLSPAKAAPLRALGWPFPAGFSQEILAAERPVVFLTDKPLFTAKAVEGSLAQAGAHPMVLQSPNGLAELLMRRSKPLSVPKAKGWWDNVWKSADSAPPSLPPMLSHIVVALVEGDAKQAASVDAEIRRLVPEAACYHVTSADPLMRAAEALRDRKPVYLKRKLAGHVSALASARLSREAVRGKQPILLVDSDQDGSAVLAQALLAAGYEVEIVRDEEAALALAAAPGRFFAAVIGVNFNYSYTYATSASTNLAGRLRDKDPAIRFIFLMDMYPMERALREMGQAIEFGADDALIKPVEPKRLLMAIERALHKRRLFLEVERLRRRASPTEADLPASEDVNLLAGRFDMVFQLGEGGMGLVFLASDRRLGRKVAIKQMRSEIKFKQEHRTKFIEEAKMVSRLSHPNIVTLFEVLDDHGEIYLIMEYIEGKSLWHVVREKKRLGLMESRALLAQVCRAMDYAHAQHVLHRDLKLSNIMIDAAGLAKVMDFGLAREMKETVSMLTQKDVGGTPAYMSPEQHLGKFGRATDVYALGVCFYEMVSGGVPFRGPDFLAQKERMNYLPLTAAVPGLPEAVDQFMAAALNPDPKLRIPGAKEFSAWLDYLVGVGPS